jgi:hypothetical protein
VEAPGQALRHALGDPASVIADYPDVHPLVDPSVLVGPGGHTIPIWARGTDRRRHRSHSKEES